jgi:hypothetical protein
MDGLIDVSPFVDSPSPRMSERSTKEDRQREQERISSYARTVLFAILDTLTDPSRDQFRLDHVHYL